LVEASYRATDPDRSRPAEPFYKLAKDSIEPVTPGEIVKYEIQLLATANQFKAGHRICVEICSLDVPTGTGAMTALYNTAAEPPSVFPTYFRGLLHSARSARHA
jgi:predicted acyl esterase